MKKSIGLKAQFISIKRYNITHFKGSKMDSFSKILPNLVKGIQKAKKDYEIELDKHAEGEKLASKEFWDGIIDKSSSLGIDLIGFAPVDENFIFEKDQTTGIEYLYNNGIVLGMEMNFEAIDTAPGPDAGLEAQRIYAKLGIATNKLADFIRSKGYGAIACHPLGGPILYPAMAKKAGLGEIGRQGLLITKKFGPRQRLSLIATNAWPLPEKPRENLKISEFCEKCGKCIRMCPVNAILEEPVVNENGTLTRIDSSKCFEYFYQTAGCSVCIKTCPFHEIGYEKVFKEN